MPSTSDAADKAMLKDKVVKLILEKKNIVVLAGAGISVPSGIPDFRSVGTGIYDTLNLEELGIDSPEDLFSIDQFLSDPRPFCRFANQLYRLEDPFQPNPAHHFLAHLSKTGRLRRVYTQNIDSLELDAGVDPSKVVQAHGNLKTWTCLGCGAEHDPKDFAADIKAGNVLYCTGERRIVQPASKKPRTYEYSNGFSPDPSSMLKKFNADMCGGILRPNIVFYGENLNPKLADNLNKDKHKVKDKESDKVDLIIVMGTSLKARTTKHVLNNWPDTVPRILINLEEPENKVTSRRSIPYQFDQLLLGPTNVICTTLLSIMGQPGLQESLFELKTHPITGKPMFVFPGGVVTTYEELESLP